MLFIHSADFGRGKEEGIYDGLRGKSFRGEMPVSILLEHSKIAFLHVKIKLIRAIKLTVGLNTRQKPSEFCRQK